MAGYGTLRTLADRSTSLTRARSSTRRSTSRRRPTSCSRSSPPAASSRPVSINARRPDSRRRSAPLPLPAFYNRVTVVVLTCNAIRECSVAGNRLRS
ncbi:MAG: hypothetical protein ACRDM1_06165 [Gaiellaceae bacterium]